MVADRYLTPNPLLTASIYCAGRSDECIQRCIGPWWHAMGAQHDSQHMYLWLMRYRRRGEHVKVRVHAPRELTEQLRAHFEDAVQMYLTGLEPARTDINESAENRHSLPIDPEDENSEPQPDHSLLWTHHRHTPIVYGPEQYIGDERYLAIFTRALGYSTDHALAALSEQKNPEIPFRVRQTTLVKSVISGLAGIDWGVAERAAYLAYHRNWLLRYLLVRTNEGQARAEQLLERFTANLGKMGVALDSIRTVLASQWGGGSPPTAGWTAALRDLHTHVNQTYGELGAGDVDPFARDRAEPAIFKVLHAAANPLGIQPLDESFVYHLLLHCHAPDMDRGFSPLPS